MDRELGRPPQDCASVRSGECLRHQGVCNFVSQATCWTSEVLFLLYLLPLSTCRELHGTTEGNKCDCVPPLAVAPVRGGELLSPTRVLHAWLKPGVGSDLSQNSYSLPLSFSLILAAVSFSAGTLGGHPDPARRQRQGLEFGLQLRLHPLLAGLLASLLLASWASIEASVHELSVALCATSLGSPGGSKFPGTTSPLSH